MAENLQEVYEFLIKTRVDATELQKFLQTLSPEQLKKLQTNVQKIINELKKELGKAGEEWSRSFVTAFQSMTVWGTAASVLYGSIRQLREFTQQIREINTLQTKMSTVLGAERANKFLSESIRLAEEYGASWDKVAQASIEWGRAIGDDEVAFQGLRKAVELGIATYSDFATISKSLIVLSQQMNLSYKEQEEVISTLFNIYQKFPGINITELMNSVLRTASQASNLGVTVSQLLTFAAHAVQIDPAFGFFGVSSFFTNILNKKDQILGFFRQWGIEIKSDGEWLRKLVEIFPTLTPDVRNQFLSIFGQFGVNVQTYFLQHGKELLDLLDQMGGSAENLAEALRNYGNSLDAVYARMKDAQADLAKNAQTVFVPAMATATNTLRGIVQALASMGPAGGLVIGGAVGGIGLLLGNKILNSLLADLAKNAPNLYTSITEKWTQAGGFKGAVLPLIITFALRYLVDATGVGGKLEEVTGVKDISNIIFDFVMQMFMVRAITAAFGLSRGWRAGLSIAIPVALTLLPRITGAGGDLASFGTKLLDISLLALGIRSVIAALARSIGGKVASIGTGPLGWVISVGISILFNVNWEWFSKSDKNAFKFGQLAKDAYEIAQREGRNFWDVYGELAQLRKNIWKQEQQEIEQTNVEAQALLSTMEKLTDQVKVLSSLFGAMPENLQNLGFQFNFLQDMLKQAISTSNLTPEQRQFLLNIAGMSIPTTGIKIPGGTLINPQEYLNFFGGQWPVLGGYTQVTGAFGTSGWFRTGLHRGIDIYAPLWTPVVAPFAGEIKEAGWTEGWGYRVVLKLENGIEMLFGHLASILVEAGQKVEAGKLLGQVGGTAGVEWGGGGPNVLEAFPAHLHFETFVPEGVGEITAEQIQSWLDLYNNATDEQKQYIAGLMQLATTTESVNQRFEELANKVKLWNIGLDNAQMQLDLASVAVSNYDRQLQNLPESIDNVAQRTTLLQGKQEALIRQYLTYQLAISATTAYLAELQNQLSQAKTEQEQMDLSKQIQSTTVSLEQMKSEAQATADALAEVNRQLQLIGYGERVEFLGSQVSKYQAQLAIQQARGTANTEDQLHFYNLILAIIRQAMSAQLDYMEVLEQTNATTEKRLDAELKYLDLKKQEAELENKIREILAQQAIYRRLQQALPGGLAGTWSSVARWISGPLPSWITQGAKETTSQTLEDIKEAISRYVIEPFDDLSSIISKIADLTRTWGDLISQGFSGIYLQFTDVTKEIFTLASGLYAQINADLLKGIPPAGSWAEKMGMKGIWVSELGAVAPGLSPREAQAWMDRYRLKMEELNKKIVAELWGPINAKVFEEFTRRGATQAELRGFQEWILTYSLLSKFAPYILEALPQEYRLPKEQIIEPERAMAMVSMERPDLVMQATIEGETMGNIIASKIREIEHPIYVNVDLGHGIVWRSQLTAPEVAASGVGLRVNAI